MAKYILFTTPSFTREDAIKVHDVLLKVWSEDHSFDFSILSAPWSGLTRFKGRIEGHEIPEELQGIRGEFEYYDE